MKVISRIIALTGLWALSAVLNTAMADSLNISPVTVTAGATAVLTFNLDNGTPYYGFQADIVLPRGITCQLNDKNQPDFNLSDRFDSSYSPYSAVLSNGTVRVGTFSSSHTPISGKSGKLFTLTVNVASNFNGGVIQVKDINFIDADNNDVTLFPVTQTVSINAPTENNNLYIEGFTIADGDTREISLILDNRLGFTAFQTDITLPSNLEFVANSVKTSSRTSNHSVSERTVGNTTRIMCWSDSKALISGLNGTVLTFSVKAIDDTPSQGKITLTNNIFTTINLQEYVLADSSAEVTVTETLPTEIILNAKNLSLLKGQSYQLTAQVLPENVKNKTVTWTSASPEVASVETDGTVTALSAGTAVITATCGEVSATCTVTVKAGGDITIKPGDGDGGDGGGSGGGDGDDDQNNENGWVEGNDIFVRLNRSITINATMPEGLDETPVLEWKLAEGGQQYVLLTVAENTLSATFKGIELGETSYTLSCNGTELLNGKVTVLPIEPKSIELSAQNLTLLKGQTDKLKATVEPEETTFNTVTWSSASPEVASVETDGTVTALSAGTAVITATCGEVSATCTVTVKSGDDITIKPGDGDGDGGDGGGSGGGDGDDDDDSKAGWVNGNDVTVKVNRTLTIGIGLPDDLSETPVFEWRLADGGSRYVTLTPGDDNLTASFTGKEVGITSYSLLLAGEELLTGKVTVIAERPMKSLLLDPAQLSLAQNALPVTLTPIYTPDNASMPEFSWSSSDATVATVSDSGEVKPINQGQTVITVIALDGTGLTAICNVTVTAPIDDNFDFDESVMGGVDGVTIYLGESVTLTPKAHDGYDLPSNIRWSTSDEAIVSVDQNGKVTGTGVGSATVTATATINGRDVSATCAVTVLPILVSKIELDHTTAELRATETLKLTATVVPDNATNPTLRWTTNAPSIASVSQEGVVTALTVGEANITARATDGSNVYASCKVNVVPTIATGISIEVDGSTTLRAEETVKLTAIVIPETTTDKSVTWRSDKPAVASVNASGVVTAVTIGTAVITATNSAGQSANVEITVEPTPVESIELNRNTAQIRVQDGFRLTATVLPVTATDKSVKWSSSNPTIVSVDGEGNVLGLNIGSSVITCEARDGSGVTAQCRITVTETATQSVSVSAEGSTTLKAEETVQLRATVLPETATDKSVRWQSDRTDIAIVDGSGLVTALSVGQALITATNSGGQSASITITVVPTPVESIDLNVKSAELKATETLSLLASVYPETATVKTLTWSSDNESVATVSQSGLVTAVAMGDAVITVKATDGSEVTARCFISVISTEVTSVRISANGPTTLKASESVQLTASLLPETATDKSVTWTSANPDVAGVNENGLVTAYGVGECVITATAASGASDQITITVIPTPVASITLNHTSVSMKVTNEMQLTATVLPLTATDKSVEWISSASDIVDVDSEGHVTALKEGQASVLCRALDGSGISASCIVNVVDTDVEIITVRAEGPTTLRVSETVQLTATVMPETSTNKEITWSSANEGVATVDQDGLVTAVSEGTATITATSSNGLSDRITITVIDTQVSSIVLNEEIVILMPRESYNLIPTIYPATATNKQLAWTSGNKDVATVSQDGTVTAVAVGETVVTASATDGSGVSASCRVSVIPIPVQSVTITALGDTELEINQTLQLTALVLPDNATDKSVEWSSSNEAVANINENGLVTALSAGETVITAMNPSGVYDRLSITVLNRFFGGIDDILPDWEYDDTSALPEGEILAIYSVEGQYLGKDPSVISKGIYIVRTTTGTVKLIR